MEDALVVEQAEQQRADVRARTVLVPAEPRDDAVGGALMLDLEHRSLARLVWGIEPLRDHAVQPRTFESVEPVGGGRAIRRRRRQVDGRLDAPEHGLEPGPTLALRRLAQVFVTERQQVPRHERGRRLRGEHLHARRGGMDAQQQRFEVEPAVASR